MRTRSTILGYVVLVLLLSAGTAQGLAGTNTVTSDDIVDGTISTLDLKTGAVSGSRILDNSVTGTDVNESTLSLRRHFVARVKVPVDGVTPPSVVDSDPSGVTVAADSVGLYSVTFPIAVNDCTVTANVANFPGAANQYLGGAFAVIDLNSPSPSVAIVSISAATADGADAVASSFMLDVSCPKL